ncbi:hypothetical protein AFLA_009373 [Aspergillus flavus NRRL3357]|nr:hypothetical protein AFLA_009373 [Aspergillus flavus NRRL3357]
MIVLTSIIPDGMFQIAMSRLAVYPSSCTKDVILHSHLHRARQDAEKLQIRRYDRHHVFLLGPLCNIGYFYEKEHKGKP